MDTFSVERGVYAAARLGATQLLCRAAIDRLVQKVAPMLVLDLHDPDVRVRVGPFAGIGVDVRLDLAQRARRQIEPYPVALASAGRRIEAGATVQGRHFDQY